MMQQGQLFADESEPQVEQTAESITAEQAPFNPADYLADREGIFQLLNDWLELGWLRALDLSLVKLLAKLDPEAEPLTLLVIALVSHQLGHGHICLDLDSLLRDPDLALLLPPEGQLVEPQQVLPSQLLAAVSVEQCLAALAHSVLLSDQEQGTAAPLVLLHKRLYLYRYWQYEVDVAEHLVRRLKTTMPLAADFTQRLSTLFNQPLIVGGQRQTDWQKVACAMAAQGQLTLITGGPGTGKTTTVVRLLALLQQSALEDGQALRVQLAAPTGKAATRLTESIGEQVTGLPVAAAVKQSIPSEVTTLHRLLGSLPNTRRFRHNSSNPLVVDVLVIDEASMIDLEMMHSVLQAMPAHARLILLGDKDQLASVEAGSVLGDLCVDAELTYYTVHTQQQLEQLCNEPVHAEPWCVGDPLRHPLAQRTVMLRHSRRFGSDSGIGQLAQAVNQGEQRLAWQLLQKPSADISYLSLNSSNAAEFERLLLGATGENPQHLGYRHYLSVLHQQRPAADKPFSADIWQQWASAVLNAFDQFRLLCALRKGDFGVAGLNERIVKLLHSRGLIAGVDGWYEGRPVLVTQNDYSLGLMNGDIGIALWLPSSEAAAGEEKPQQVLRVVFARNDGTGGVRFILPSRLTAVETVFAMTVHKSQGSEFAHTALVLPDRLNPVLSKELLYTGITRARNKFTLVESQTGVFVAAVQRKVERSSGLNAAIITQATKVYS